LSFQKGDQMTLLDRSIPDWWLVKKRKNGEHGYVPRNYVAKLVDDESEEWYAGRMPRNRATNAVTVSHLPKGAFLIRERELNPSEFALTVRDIDEQGKASAKHYKIKRNRDGRFYITPSRMFESLRHLVIHYETQADGLCCQLTSAVPRIAPTRPELSHLTRDNWEIPKEQIRLEKMIGSGNFGQVWHGYWRDIIEVAVKTMKPGSMLATEFLAEATIMKKFDHLNLVKLYAVCTKEEPFYIVTEYMVNGSLLNYLQNGGRNLSNTALLDMCAQVASGMTYLESKKLVHRDLAARNVLVGDFFNGSLIVKIADFGLARWLREDYVYEARVATMFPVKWTAPEAARMGNFTIKSDVWSYGVLIFEVTSHGGSPYSDFDTKEVIAKVESGYRLPKPADCPQRIYDDIMLECWNQEPTRRPTFASISRYFDKFFNNDPMFS
uniref:Tyrosine-protein kinase n=1 Tax=Anisakis simplex TaxID=6269 RepID=A0A0M3JTJ3_ANISI